MQLFIDLGNSSGDMDAFFVQDTDFDDASAPLWTCRPTSTMSMGRLRVTRRFLTHPQG
jgi:hypothetical protein